MEDRIKGLATLNKDMEEIKNKLEPKKKFKLPFGTKMGATSKVKKNYVLALVLRENGGLDIKWLPINDGMVYYSRNKTFHVATTDYIGYYKKYPYIILPEWRLQPISRDELINEKTDNEASSQKVLIDIMERAKLKGGGLGGGKLLWIIIGLAAAFYMIYSSQTK
jgi:hypothetical protein